MSRLSAAPLEFEGLFQLFDGDGDGSITAAELERSLANLGDAIPAGAADGLRTLVQRQGVVQAEQFTAWAQAQRCFDLITTLRELFTVVDANGDGTLCRGEIGEMLRLLDHTATEEAIEAFLAAYDHDGDGRITAAEFLRVLALQGEDRLSLADLKRLKKTALQYSGAARSPRVTLVEVDCDLGAGTPGAGSGIELLKQAARRQQALRELSDALVAEIQDSLQPAQARAASADPQSAVRTPHARHIHSISGVLSEVAELVCDVRRQGLFPLVLAGDHSTAAGTMAGLRRAHPESRIGVVWIDAHADIHSPFTTPSGNMHGMPLAIAARHDNCDHAVQAPDPSTLDLWQRCQELAGEGRSAIELTDLIYVSVRDTEPAEQQTLRNHSIPVISTEEVRQIGPEAAARRCLDYLAGCDLIYVSFDVDSMDATICKGTGTPVPGGLWADEARRLNQTLLADPRVVCWEICEINPHLDTLNTLAEVSLGVYQEVLGVLQRRL